MLLGLSLCSCGSPFAAHAFERDEIAGRVAPSVVHITGYMGQQGQEPYAEASGFFLDEGGYLISVSNVFTNPKTRRLCERYSLRLSGGRELHARMHSVDAILNLIILKVIEPGTYPAVDTDFTAVRPGDGVLALSGGNIPSADSYTAGYVKARHKTSIYGAGLGDMFIDSHIRLPDHAFGGPLLNRQGKVIGINTPNIHRPNTEIAGPDEAHALPARVLKGFYRVSKTYPTSRQKWLGLAFRPLNPGEKTEVYRLLGHRAGVLVDFVWDEGPASRSGIQPGDVLFSVNGKALSHLHELVRLLIEPDIGSMAELALLRDGRAKIRKVRIEKRPAWAGYVNWRNPTVR